MSSDLRLHDEALQQATGRNVKVAVIDSGINAHHSHVRQVSGGVKITCDASGEIAFSDDYRDYDGHGTAVAGIIRAKAPGVVLYSVKILQDRLRTESRVLAAAIRSSIANDMRVINMSLGTHQISGIDALRQACEAAAGRNIILIAAGSEERIFPASYSCVLGVSGDERCGWNDYAYTENGEVEFRAHSCPLPLPGLPQTHNLRGHSMAAAHVTALVARIVEAYPQADVHAVREILIRECSRRVEAEHDALNPDPAPNNTQLPAAQSNRVSNER
jgi:subtilisin